MTTTLSYTLETLLLPNPDWPGGYASSLFGQQTFDFTRNWFYAPISAPGQGGVAVTDLTAMQVIKTPTTNQMYAGTPFGATPGVPWIQSWNELTCGNGTDLFAIVQVTVFQRYFTRINPVTMKVSGEITSDTNAGGGVVNTTATRTIVAYANADASHGAYIYDGTAVALITILPPPTYGTGNNYLLIPGPKHLDGSCDFFVLNADNGGTSGNIDIWRIKVTNSLVVTNVKTGTVHTLGIVPVTSNLYCGEANYDVTNDRLLIFVTNQFTPNSAPAWIMSVDFDGTINWVNGPQDQGGSIYNRGQSQLTSTTFTYGDSANLTTLDPLTGNPVFTGGILVSGTTAGSFFRIWDASRNAYWTYALSRGFTRVDFHTDTQTLTDAELFFSPTASFMDLAVEANRRLFISTRGTPQWLETTGDLPLNGQAPRVYLSVSGAVPATFANNNGTGGSFAITHGPMMLATPPPGCSPYFITEAAGPASKPEWRLSVSDDGARTWSTLVKPRDIGATGQYKTRLRWLKMGHFRQRSIKLECTDPVRRNIIGIYLDDTQGMS